MSSEAPGPDIQLHFCQACGVSIPQADIDAGRARPDPDTCAWLHYPERCPIKFGAQASAPVAAAPAPAPTPAPRPVAAKPAGPRSGTYALTALALLYVVGATTFLLSRELTREPPKQIRDDLATSAAVQHVATKIDEVVAQTQRAFSELRGNDHNQRGDLSSLSEKLNDLRQETTRLSRVMRTDIEDLQGTVLTISKRTGLLKENDETILSELRGLSDRFAAGGGPAPTKPEPGVSEKGGDEKPAPAKPPRSREEVERERLVREYIAKLADRKASDQTRYNAAVQLGDLKHPDAVQPLIKALQKDRYDLVCRAAAWSLGMFGKDAIPAIPALIGEIGGKQEYVGYMCERALGEITKAVLGKAVTFNFDPTMSQRERRKVQKKWEEWWAKNRAQLLPDG
ncbi:MAG: HEAT repeat domain-containing protein [Planctomycetota bacterium]|jgi:hypothetical protein